jgi:hypothetical protein
MRWSQLQRPVLLVPSVSWQRWALIAVAVITALAASTFTALAARHPAVVALVLVGMLGVASVTWPDSHAATAVEAIVVVQWLTTTDATTTAWTIPVALCLFVFHVVIALMALTPISATVARSTLLRWSRRCGWVVVATLGMWALVSVMAEQRARGSAVLTAVGFIALAGLILFSRPKDDRDPTRHL